MTDPSEGEAADPLPWSAPRDGSVVDVLVVGSGVAGLSAALELSRQIRRPSILVLTRGSLGGHGASALAQGGVAAAVDPSDSPALHALDTQAAGAGLARPDLVEILTRDGPDRVRELIDMGTRFDRGASGSLALGLEGAHSRHRILHAMGDRTGAEVTRALRDTVRRAEGVWIREHVEVVDLLMGSSGVTGVVARDASGLRLQIRARATLLATGGAGRVYLRTTSPPGLNGDGLAMAARAGAEVRDMEFMQFHPTALNVDRDPLPLVTEALRGAGARLVDGDGNPVLEPDEVDELAGRDRVARALWRRIRAGTPVFLDARGALGAEIPSQFPGVYHLCRTHGVDPTRELIPVTPAAHYHMGGIAVDREGSTSVRGLWAVGEVAASGVHGANRLASNSLLEGLVFGPRTARSIVAALGSAPEGGPIGPDSPPAPSANGTSRPGHAPPPPPELPPEVILRIRTLLWEGVGLVRDGEGIRRAIHELEELETVWRSHVPDAQRHLLLVGRLIAHAALLREESRGSHYRTDFPDEAPPPPRHSLLHVEAGSGAVQGSLAPVDGVAPISASARSPSP